MKKTNKILLAAVILAVVFTAMPIIAQESLYPVSDFNIPGFKDEYYIQPDPNNPYQGTWIAKGNRTAMYKIEGMEATGYVYVRTLFVRGWDIVGVYQINDKWILSDNNNTLNDGYRLLERYIK